MTAPADHLWLALAWDVQCDTWSFWWGRAPALRRSQCDHSFVCDPLIVSSDGTSALHPSATRYVKAMMTDSVSGIQVSSWASQPVPRILQRLECHWLVCIWLTACFWIVFHEEVVHFDHRPFGVVFTSSFARMVMGSSSACVHQSLNGVWVALCSSLFFWVGLLCGPTLTSQRSVSTLQSTPSTCGSSTIVASSPSVNPFNSKVFSSLLVTLPISLLSFSGTLNTTPLHHLSVIFHPSYRFTDGADVTHCPRQLKTGPASSSQVHKFIVDTPLFTSSLVVVHLEYFECASGSHLTPRRSRLAQPFFMDIGSSTTFELSNFMFRRIPSLILKSIVLRPMSLVRATFATTKFFAALFSNFGWKRQVSRELQLQCPWSISSSSLILDNCDFPRVWIWIALNFQEWDVRFCLQFSRALLAYVFLTLFILTFFQYACSSWSFSCVSS